MGNIKSDIIYKYIEEIQKEAGKAKLDEQTIYYLICKKHIPEQLRRDYLILKDYDKLLKKNRGRCTPTVCDLSIKYKMSERMVYVILKEKRGLNIPVNLSDK